MSCRFGRSTGHGVERFSIEQIKAYNGTKAYGAAIVLRYRRSNRKSDLAGVTNAWRLCPLDLKIRMDEIRAPPKIRQL